MDLLAASSPHEDHDTIHDWLDPGLECRARLEEEDARAPTRPCSEEEARQLRRKYRSFNGALASHFVGQNLSLSQAGGKPRTNFITKMKLQPRAVSATGETLVTPTTVS